MSEKRKSNAVDDDEHYINTDLLIIEVEVRPILYSVPDCSDLNDKDIRKAWTEVASNVNVTINDCVKTWTKLVKTFRHFRDKSSNKMFERWTYYEQMQFITPYINEPLLAEDVVCRPVTSSSPNPEIIEVHDVDENGLDAFTKYECPMDNEDMFLLSFAQNLKRLSPKKNGLARLRILDELYKLEFEEE